jgi:hypothetical protein
MKVRLDHEVPEEAVRAMLTEPVWSSSYSGYWAPEEYEARARPKITEAVLRRGFEALARMQHPMLGQLLRGEYDAPSLDVLVQAGLLGEVRYG